MKRLTFLIFLLSAMMNLFAQTETPASSAAAGKFEALYNEDKFSEIFDMFSAEMKAALPLEKTTAFFNQVKGQSGKIRSREFERYQNTYASYKTQFERGIFTVSISVDDLNKINGMFIKPYQSDNLPKPERNTTSLILPFKGEWTVFWGGDTKELNYHVAHKAQKNAFDLLMTGPSGKSFRTDGKTNEDYLVFGQEIIAPCDGEVVLAVDGIKDNKPGDMNPTYVPGNTVIIRTSKNEYLFFAHFKKHSLKVKEGQQVKRGDLLGLCGNSGNSSEPHLHFHIQNVEEMNMATGVKCYFSEILVNGTARTDYSPIKGEKIKNKN